MSPELSDRIDAQIETLLKTILTTRKFMRECIVEARQITGKPEKPRPSGRGGIGRHA